MHKDAQIEVLKHLQDRVLKSQEHSLVEIVNMVEKINNAILYWTDRK
jgi:hypothetical protein